MINYQERRFMLKRMVKSYYDLQKTLILINNRYGFKKNGDTMNRETVMLESEVALHGAMAESQGMLMTKLEKDIKTELKEWSIWTEWLRGVKGVGWTMAAVMCAEYDIYIATTVSKMWQFTGLNPSMVRGKALKGKEIVLTDTMIRGDRRTPGFISPFNGWLRTKMVGVLGPGFLKAKSDYALQFYYPYRERLENEEGWKDESKGHRHNAAIRYMIKKGFLKDLYANWRTLEGLPVRVPYEEEYLDHKHAS